MLSEPDTLRDSFGRTISYLRLSVTDRCDLRCTYCMPKKMTFLPKKDVLSLEELERLTDAFIARGIKKIRITGGEPLVRRDILELMERLGNRLQAGAFDELTLTTNGTQLAKHAVALKSFGVKRINVSLDTLKPKLFKQLTRRDAITDVLHGIEAARVAGLNVKINMVALKGVNEQEVEEMVRWTHQWGMDLTLIEVMPLGAVDEDRFDQYLPLSRVRKNLENHFTLIPLEKTTGGPAQYVRVEETGGTLGFITPLTNNFCSACNRVRVTCTGQIYTCLGQTNRIDLRAALRSETPKIALNSALDKAIRNKPERHNFDISRKESVPALARHMSTTGG